MSRVWISAYTGLAVALLLAVFSLNDLAVIGSEAQALWVVRDHPAPNATITERISGDVESFLTRVQEQPQPPLYFLLLDVWTLAAGGGILAARILSLLLVIPAVIVAAYMMPDARTGRPSLEAGLFMAAVCLIPATRATPHTLVMLASALATWRLLCLKRRATWPNAILYTMGLVLAFGSAHIALWLFLLHLTYAHLHGLKRRVFLAAIFALVPYLAWLSLAGIDLDGALLSGQTLILIALALLAAALPGLVTFAQSIPNTPRILPVPLLAIAILSIVWLLRAPSHPEYADTLASLRQPDEPVLYDFPPDHPANAYNAQDDTQLTAGLSINLGWQPQNTETLAIALAAVENAGSVWAMLPDDASAWGQIESTLLAGRTIGVDRSQQAMRFVRYDRE